MTVEPQFKLGQETGVLMVEPIRMPGLPTCRRKLFNTANMSSCFRMRVRGSRMPSVAAMRNCDLRRLDHGQVRSGNAPLVGAASRRPRAPRQHGLFEYAGPIRRVNQSDRRPPDNRAPSAQR